MRCDANLIVGSVQYEYNWNFNSECTETLDTQSDLVLFFFFYTDLCVVFTYKTEYFRVSYGGFYG